MRARGRMGLLYIWYVPPPDIEYKPNLAFSRVKIP